MSTLILHHYAMSPFSEKVRAMLGYTQLSWQSVITREMPPRPMLARLAGGYRKIPVAQSGADVFCDSRIIASEIATQSNKPELDLFNCSAEIQDFVKEVDLEVFFACLMVSGSKELRKKVWDSMSLLDIARFAWDRINMGRSAKVNMGRPTEAKAKVRAHLERLEAMFSQSFLFGDAPCHADFSAYHSLWFIRDLGEKRFINDYPNTIAWMDRMKGFGHGNSSEITAEAALSQAKGAQPRSIAEEHRQDSLIGKTVSIAPADYGRDATTGTLVGSLPERLILARQDGELGTLHVHFPRNGYQIQAL